MNHCVSSWRLHNIHPLFLPVTISFADRYTVGTCTPSSQMPQFLSNLNDNTLTFRTAEGLAYAAADSWGSSPEALGWNQGMRWGTALMFIDFAAALQKIMPEVAYPFLIIHDPLDQVCNIEGGKNLMEQSQTAPDKKKLIEVYIGYLCVFGVRLYCIIMCDDR